MKLDDRIRAATERYSVESTRRLLRQHAYTSAEWDAHVAAIVKQIERGEKLRRNRLFGKAKDAP